MRYAPVAAALSLLAAVTSSMSWSAPTEEFGARATTLMAEGRAAQSAGRINAAIDAYEAALTLHPGSVTILLDLASATRMQGMQGKALHYYREALETDPRNLSAISGEGAALAEKGALEKARQNLTRLETMCGKDCSETKTLAAVIAKGPAPRVVRAEAVKPDPVISEN